MPRAIEEKPITDDLGRRLGALDGRLHQVAPLPRPLNPATLYLEGKAESGARSCRSQLKKIASWLGFFSDQVSDYHLDVPWHALEAPDIQTIMNCYRKKGYRDATVSLAFATLRGILRQAYLGKLIDDQQWVMIRELAEKKSRHGLSGREIKEREIKALLAACNDGTVRGVRDLAILALMRGTGLRRGDLARLRHDNLDLDSGVLTLEVKGGKEHDHPLPPGTIQALRKWYRLRGYSGYSVFVRIFKDDRMNFLGSFTGQAVYHLLEKRIAVAGIAKCTPHDIRRTFITDLIRQKGLSIAQDFAGHSSPETTKRYDMSSLDERKTVAQTISIPLPEDEEG